MRACPDHHRTTSSWRLAGLCSLALLAACAPAVPSPTAPPKPTAAAAAPAASAQPTQAPAARPTEKPAAKPTEVAKPAAQPAEAKPTVAPAKPTQAAAAKPAFDDKAVADFYRGKTVKILVGLSAGGGFDLTSRILARHMPKYLPGNPTIIVENRPGAGSALAANAIYNTEPKDGTIIGNVDSSTVFRQALGQPGVEYDAARFQWLGATLKDATACLARAESGVKTIQDSINGKEVVLGTLGLGNNSHDVPLVLNATLGSKLKLVPGYQGANNVRLAVDNKEVDGFCITFKSGFLVGDRQRLEGQNPVARVFVVMGEKVPDHPLTKDLPSVLSLAKTEDDRQMLRAVDAAQLINKPYLVAPEVPRDRVEALRRALAAAYADPAFLDESKKANLDVDPSSGEETTRVVQQVLATPPAVVARLKEVLK